MKQATKWEDGVLAVMQQAEELGGPELQDYLRGMARVAREAQQRAATAAAKVEGDFRMGHLTGEALEIALLVYGFLVETNPWERQPTGGGSRAFYTPAEWAERGEQYCRGALLVLVHDGGDLAPVCNLDYEDPRWEEFLHYMLAHDYVVESGTCWYAGVYRVRE